MDNEVRNNTIIHRNDKFSEKDYIYKTDAGFGEKAQIHFLFSHSKSHTFHPLQGQRVNLFQIQSKSINKGITINVEYRISFLSGRVESKPII